MAPINVSTSEQQITATVTGDNSVTATVQAGFGATGPQGPAATIAVGTVTTGAPGTSASVVNAGTSGAAVLNFSIPAGATGATGATGPAGPAGSAGAAGAAATVTVGTVTTGAAGSSASVTNVGSSSAAVLNFTIPAGATGSQGPAGAKGDPGDPATLPSGTEGYVLTYVGGNWVAAATANPFDQDLNSGSNPEFASAVISSLSATEASASTMLVGDTLTFGDSSVQTTAWTGSLPTATNSVLGGVKIGSGVTITDGVISVSTDYAAAVHATEHHPDGSDPLALVASTGNYNDLVDKPSLAAVATSGSYTDINGIPSLAQVATSGSYNDLANTPSLAQVATSGSYNDLSNTPTLGTAAGADIGTGAAEVAAGNHTHSQLHDRSHAITSTSDHTATNWRLFHSNGSGQVVELAFGNSGQALISQGASAAPTWGQAGSTSASDLTSGTLANARMTTRARAAMNLYLWSSFR